MKRAGSFWQPPIHPPPAWGCLSLDVWLLLWIMNYDPQRLPSGHRWIGGKAAHLRSGVGEHFYCMRGRGCLCKVLHVPLPSAHHAGVRLTERLNGPKIPSCEQVWVMVFFHNWNSKKIWGFFSKLFPGFFIARQETWADKWWTDMQQWYPAACGHQDSY